jgi:hypothetical protein
MFYSCRQKKTVERAESKEPALYTIDLDSIKTVDSIKMSSIFGKARAIILEETDYSLIGGISKFQVFDNYVFVLDRNGAKKLFVFDKKNGKYLRQIGSLGQGPGEYIEIRDFCLDVANREVYIYDPGKHRLHKYNMDNGKYVESVNMQHNDRFFHFIMYLNNRIYANILKSDKLLAELDIETSVYREFLNADEYNCGWSESIFMAYSSFFISDLDSPKFVELLMPTVISIDETGLRPYLTVKSKDWVQKSDVNGDDEQTRSMQFGLDLISKRRAYCIQNYMEFGDYICFDYRRGFLFFVVFNKKTGEAFQCNKINLKPDLLTAGGAYFSLLFPFTTVKNAYGLWHYYNANSRTKIQLTEEQIAKDLENREELIKTLQSRKDDEFYVIFEYEFK